MGIVILLLLIVVPIIEIAVFIRVGGEIGLVNTLAVVIATAALGTYLLRRQGLATLFRIQQTLDENKLPLRELFDGLCLLVAGALLLTPGFVTDAFGFVLFLPPFRRYLAGLLAQYFITHGRVDINMGDGAQNSPGAGPGGVIDGEFEDLTRDDRAKPVPPDKRLPND